MRTFIDPDQALDIVLKAANKRPETSLPLEEAGGRLLAEPLLADRDYPPFDKAMMDGVAVLDSDAGAIVTSTATVVAGESAEAGVNAGTCVEIMTGAPVPAGATAVVPVEQIHVDGDQIRLPERIESGQNISRKGQDVAANQRLLSPGNVITPLVIANLATIGAREVSVISPPRVAIIVTGDELTDDAAITGSKIRDANGPMLRLMAADLGVQTISMDHAPDSLAAITEALRKASDHDIIILSGGVSMGSKDHVPAAVEAYGGETYFHKVSQKPGKPLLFARRESQLIFGLPGNPLSCHLCFHRYIARAIRIMSGFPGYGQGHGGLLTSAVDNAGDRVYFQLVKVTRGDDNRYRVMPLKGSGSADTFAVIEANAYVRLDPGDKLNENDMVIFEWNGVHRWTS